MKLILLENTPQDLGKMLSVLSIVVVTLLILLVMNIYKVHKLKTKLKALENK